MLALGVAACTAPPAPPPPVKAPPPPPQVSRPPQPPAGIDPAYELPAKDSDGRFLFDRVMLNANDTARAVREWEYVQDLFADAGLVEPLYRHEVLFHGTFLLLDSQEI